MKLTQSKTVRFSPAWGGNDELPQEEKFSIVLQPMQRAQYFAVVNEIMSLKAIGKEQGSLADLAEIAKTDKTAAAKASLEVANTIVAMYERFGLASQIASIDNLYFNEAPVTPAQLLDEPVYTPLIVEVVMKLIEISSLTEIETKK